MLAMDKVKNWNKKVEEMKDLYLENLKKQVLQMNGKRWIMKEKLYSIYF